MVNSEGDNYHVTTEGNEKINQTIPQVKASINVSKYNSELKNDFGSDGDTFFNPNHKNVEEIYAFSDPGKDNLLKMASLKCINDEKDKVEEFLLY